MSISSEGQTLVQFRSVDNVSRVSPWVQAQVRIDTVKPSAPAVSGGSLTWKNVAQIAISASGSTDQAGGSGFAGYQYQVSTNSGATWTAAAAGNSFTVVNEGQTLVQFRSVDNAGNVSAWTPSRERGHEYGTDRPQRAERADGDGWQRCDELLPEKDGVRVGQQRRGRVGAGALPVPGVAGQRRDVGRDDLGDHP